MNTETEQRTFTNRDFVGLVRAELAAAGRPDVAIERNWIDEDGPGEPFLLHVPVGTELSVPLRAKHDFLSVHTSEDRQRCAVEFAKALINLRSAETMLAKYARDVRKAANAAIATARADGLDILLDRVGFKPTYAFHLTYESWKDAASHVLADVRIRHTSFYLRPETSSVYVEEPADVADEIATILADQRERQDRMAELDAQGADLTVHQITLDLIASHALDPAEVLLTVWKNQHASYEVECPGYNTRLSLVSGDGVVTASIATAEAYWNGERLWFTNEEAEKNHTGLVGKSLGYLVPHSVFRTRPIVAVTNRPIDHISFDLSDKSLFDGDTGRIWREERLAA